jgi:hypothetical protein
MVTLQMLTPMPADTRCRQPGRPAALVADISSRAGMQRSATVALARRMFVTHGGAAMPELSIRLAANLRVPVPPARLPRLTALIGAGLAAMATCRNRATAAV